MCGGALIRVFLGLLFFGVRVGAEDCPIQVHPPSVVVRHGDPVSVNCTVSGDHEGIGWEASEGSVDMVTDVQFVTWSLEHLTDWNTGPRCYGNIVNNTREFQCLETLHIILYKTPDSISISAVNHTGPMVEGEQYQLQCDVQNIAPVRYLNVKWYKWETLENQTSYDDLTKTPVNVSSTLLITPTSTDDGAQYSCVAELELGPEGPQPPLEDKSEPFTTTVHYKPRITECLNSVELKEGEPLDSVLCRAKGNPLPTLTFYRNQSEFNSSTPLTRKDAGQYTLGANNPYGTALHTLEIQVLYPPSVFAELEDHEVDLGMAVVLKCSSQGNPRPMYRWRYHGAPNVQEHKHYGVSLLNISRASVENNGNYSCSAQNKLGHISKTIRLTVRGENKSSHQMRNDLVVAMGSGLEKPMGLACGSSTLTPLLQMEPPTVVVRHGDPVSVNCTVSGDHDGIGWEASEGSVDMVTDVQFVTWSLEHLTDWNTEPRCYGNIVNNTREFQCLETLHIILYKTPDSISISAVNHTGPMVEGEQYQLQCDVQNIAPVRYLNVKWYKGERLENQTSYDDLTKTPVNVSSTLLITPTSTDDGAQYSCVAELELGPEGPKPPLEDKSEPFTTTVHYPPSFSSPNDETLEVIEEQGVLLNCHAQGNPPPEYSWSSPLNPEERANQTLITSTSLSPGIYIYTCTASNHLRNQTKNFTIKITPIVDYLPLIAGIVALAVVFISVAFIFIYCIYYKNTKMGQYDLKVGKSSAQNGDVAQNGRDNTLPMKKLTKPGMCV